MQPIVLAFCISELNEFTSAMQTALQQNTNENAMQCYEYHGTFYKLKNESKN